MPRISKCMKQKLKNLREEHTILVRDYTSPLPGTDWNRQKPRKKRTKQKQNKLTKKAIIGERPWWAKKWH